MNDEYICDDRPIKASEEIEKMSQEEIDDEFKRIFKEYLDLEK